MNFRLGHRPPLDGLRGIAVLSVMLGHLSLVGAKADLRDEFSNLPIAAPGFLPGGVFGVDIFYVLSGFLITSLLLEESRQNGNFRLGPFYMRRVLRLGPALLLLMAFASLYILLAGPSRGSFGFAAVLWAIGYVSNYAGGFHVNMGMLTHTWSLCLEEQFYLIWPISLVFLVRLPARRLLTFVVLGAIGSAILRYIVWRQGHLTLAWGSLPCRADGLLSGIAVAIMANQGWLNGAKVAPFMRRLTWASAIVLALSLIFINGASPFLYKGGYFLISVTTAALIAGLISNPPTFVQKILSLKPLTFTGKISYGLYLYHMPIYCLFAWQRLSFLPKPLLVLACASIVFAMAFVVAYLSFIFVERPALSLKRRFSSHRHAAEPLAAAGVLSSDQVA
jgi:peptidoglycan/LPS O-acetylase OafA/YrhL